MYWSREYAISYHNFRGGGGQNLGYVWTWFFYIYYRVIPQILWKDGLNSDGQQFHTSNNWTKNDHDINASW